VISGFATPEGTAKFASSHASVPPQNYKKIRDLMLSNVGVGTYLGEPDAATDTLVTGAIRASIESGINVIDTAINYRSQKAERCVRKAVSELVEEGRISRDQIFVSTKNGYVTGDADVPMDFWPYVNREYVKNGVISEGDISSGYHCMTVAYLEDQLERSLRNLGLESADLMYLHNVVEGQIKDASREEILEMLLRAFEMYEQKRDEERIRFYGMATWESFRVGAKDPRHLPLDEILDLARKAGGPDHGFRFIQLPFNMYYDQALLLKNHVLDGSPASVLEVAKSRQIGVFSSVPFMQGRLLQPGTMPEFGDLPSNLRALQFVRSAPGMAAPLVGHKSAEHVSENLKIMRIRPLEGAEFADLVKKLTS